MVRMEHLDFVEIGSCDWGTLVGVFYGSPLERYRCTFGLRYGGKMWRMRQNKKPHGVVVEPVLEYLQSLQRNFKTDGSVKFINAAIGPNTGSCKLNLVPPRLLSMLDEQSCPWYTGSGKATTVNVAWYARSMSSVGSKHPELTYMLKKIDGMHYLKSRNVTMLTWADLVAKVKMRSVDLVKIDAEGMDCKIIDSMLEYCKEHPEAYPKVIKFEANCLTQEYDILMTMEKLRHLGYFVQRYSHDVIAEWLDE